MNTFSYVDTLNLQIIVYYFIDGSKYNPLLGNMKKSKYLILSLASPAWLPSCSVPELRVDEERAAHDGNSLFRCSPSPRLISTAGRLHRLPPRAGQCLCRMSLLTLSRDPRAQPGARALLPLQASEPALS